MPKTIVVDTNVLIAANGSDKEWIQIALKCAQRLKQVQDGETICIDSSRLILREYSRHLPGARKGFGDMFFLWLVQNQMNATHCLQVTVNPTNQESTEFAEFPNLGAELTPLIDPSDRKFIAVSHAAPNETPILQATDSKWWGWKAGLAEAGIPVEFIDDEFLRPIYEKKMGKGE